MSCSGSGARQATTSIGRYSTARIAVAAGQETQAASVIVTLPPEGARGMDGVIVSTSNGVALG